MKKQMFFLCLPLFFASPIFAKELAITIDDLPLVHQSRHSQKEEIVIFNEILKILDCHRISVLGFVNGNKIKQPYHQELLNKFLKKGHLLGNHTFSHVDLNDTSITAYLEDIIRGEKAISKWMTVKYFRYPCLHQGNTAEKQKAVYDFLIKNHYTTVPVTIDNDDFLFNDRFEIAEKEGKVEEMKAISKKYLEHMKERTIYFERMARKKMKREVKQILLIHMNYLNSLFLNDLLVWYHEQGWHFVTVPQALADDIYHIQGQNISKKGLSQLERLAGSDK